jgi:hypothetical protein
MPAAAFARVDGQGLRVVSVVASSPSTVDVGVVLPPRQESGDFSVRLNGTELPVKPWRLLRRYFEVGLAIYPGERASPEDVAALQSAAVEFVLRLPEAVSLRVLGASDSAAPSPVASVMAAATAGEPSIEDVASFATSMRRRSGASGALVWFTTGAADAGALEDAAVAIRDAPITLHAFGLDGPEPIEGQGGAPVQVFSNGGEMQKVAGELAQQFARHWVLTVTVDGSTDRDVEVTWSSGASTLRRVVPLSGVEALEGLTGAPNDGPSDDRRDRSLRFLGAVLSVCALVALASTVAVNAANRSANARGRSSLVLQRVAEDLPYATAIFAVSALGLFVWYLAR